MIPQSGVDAAGIMHTSAEIVADALKVVRGHFGGPLMAYPDSGYFEMPDWRFVDVIAPQRFEAFCGDWIASGVQIIGGGCGGRVEGSLLPASLARSLIGGPRGKRSSREARVAP